MSESCRYWIRLVMLAAIVLGSGLSLVSPAAFAHAGNAHEHSGILDGAPSLTAGGSHDHGCHGGAIAGTHCAEVHCCPSALQLASTRLSLAFKRDTFVEWGGSIHYGQHSYPLLRPPIAIA